MNIYQQMIRAVAPDMPAHQVEAAMRVTAGTLDGMGRAEFNLAARTAASAVQDMGPDRAAALAASYGLTAEEA